MNIDRLFEIFSNEQFDKHINKFNTLVSKLDERKRSECTIRPTDSGNQIRRKCKKARVWGVHYAPVWDMYMSASDASPSGGDGGGEGTGGIGEIHGSGLVFPNSTGPEQDDELINDAKSSTERVRRYYRRHPEKVRKYLKKTQKDRVARNRDRRKAVKKHGKSKMKNHDVHHPNGPHGGKWKLAKKDHGPDKKNENVAYVYLSEIIEGNVPNGPWVLLSEGGAAGHMAHPYEDDTLSFKDVKEMITRGLVGKLDAEGPVTEKLDGQNITFSVRDGQVVFARNKGQIKNRGANALDVSGVRGMFSGHANPNVEKAFVRSAEDLEAAIAALPPEEREKMFANGSKFMNVEVIFPDTKNIIPYDKPVLVFHGTIEYDEAGEEVGRNIDDGKTLETQLQAVNARNQQTFGISGPQAITFNDADTARNKERLRQYGAEVSRIQSEFDLDDNATIEDYKRAWWSREIDNMGIDWTPEEKEGLISRWAMGDKGFGVKHIKDEEKKAQFRQFEGEQLKRMQKLASRPLERLFLRVGADTLLRVTNTLSGNNPQMAKELKREVMDVIKQVQETGDENQLAILQQQIERLEDIGIDNIVPTEGVVFMYNGKPYKFTGTFAPVNQILGIMKFARGKAKEVAPDTTEPTTDTTPKQDTPTTTEPQAEPESGPQKPIAIFPGRFQPFHAGHYSIYQMLVQKFGKENVYIATSDKTDAVNSPFDFNEKQDIMTTMFGIPEDRIIKTAQPYRPIEITGNLPDNTPVVMSFSEKDAGRMGGKYFKSYEDGAEMAGYKEHGYIIIAPEMQLQLNGKNVSGTQVRELMGNPQITDEAKKEIFTKIYGKFDPDIFKKLVKVTTDSEEARQLTQQYGGTATKKKPKETPATSEKPTAGDAPQPTADTGKTGTPQDPSFYQPGQTWQSPNNNWGGKNSKGKIRYFGTEDGAKQFATK
jgi:hypothetical protein